MWKALLNLITKLPSITVRHVGGTSFCDPIGHVQIDGDYRRLGSPANVGYCERRGPKYAETITTALGGYGIFGVELFIRGDEVLFSEVSPRPHDTGMVTMISQDPLPLALHARAILDYPFLRFGNSALPPPRDSWWSDSQDVSFGNLNQARKRRMSSCYLFGKPRLKDSVEWGLLLPAETRSNMPRKRQSTQVPPYPFLLDETSLLHQNP